MTGLRTSFDIPDSNTRLATPRLGLAAMAWDAPTARDSGKAETPFCGKARCAGAELASSSRSASFCTCMAASKVLAWKRWSSVSSVSRSAARAWSSSLRSRKRSLLPFK